MWLKRWKSHRMRRRRLWLLQLCWNQRILGRCIGTSFWWWKGAPGRILFGQRQDWLWWMSAAKCQTGPVLHSGLLNQRNLKKSMNWMNQRIALHSIADHSDSPGFPLCPLLVHSDQSADQSAGYMSQQWENPPTVSAEAAPHQVSPDPECWSESCQQSGCQGLLLDCRQWQRMKLWFEMQWLFALLAVLAAVAAG